MGDYAYTSTSGGYPAPAAGGTYAQPVTVVQSQPNVVYVNGQPAGYGHNGNVVANIGILDMNTRPKPNGEWSDNICDWPKNLYPSCYCSSCCLYGMYIFAQMSEKTGFMTFRTVLYMTSAVYIISFILQLIFGSGLVSYLPLFFAMFFSIFFRLHVVRRENIRTNGEFLECCIACWCLPCSTAQIARHLYGYVKVFDGDSDLDRRDNYVQNV